VDKNAVMHTVVSRSRKFCVLDTFVCAAYIRQLSRLGLWPVQLETRNINDVLSALNGFQEIDLGKQFGFDTRCRFALCDACSLGTKRKIDQLVKEVEQGVKGLCLDCVRNGPQKEGCRIRRC